MSRLLKTIWSILREIADEGAYQRHLHFHKLDHSGAEWRRFCDARLARKYARAKCC